MVARAARWLVVASFCWCLGCSVGEPGMAPVSGLLVDQEGKPVAEAALTFYPSEGRSSVATTDENGAFTLYYDIGKPGAKVGEHIVTITTNATAEMPPPGAPAEAFKKYKPPLTYDIPEKIEVVEGTNDLKIQLPEKPR